MRVLQELLGAARTGESHAHGRGGTVSGDRVSVGRQCTPSVGRPAERDHGERGAGRLCEPLTSNARHSDHMIAGAFCSTVKCHGEAASELDCGAVSVVV